LELNADLDLGKFVFLHMVIGHRQIWIDHNVPATPDMMLGVTFRKHFCPTFPSIDQGQSVFASSAPWHCLDYSKHFVLNTE
jgi:hypothetical protein